MFKTVVCIALAGWSVASYFNGKGCWLDTDTMCSSCDYSKKRCNACNNGYVDKKWNNCSRRMVYIPFCSFYATHNTCQTCATGYQPDTRGVCLPFKSSIAGCWQESNGKCLYCNDARYYPDAQGNCGTKVCQTVNCGGCKPDGTCGMCMNGFVILDGDCIDTANLPALTNCSVATDVLTCNTCVAGYNIRSGSCVKAQTTSLVSIILEQLRSTSLLKGSTR